MAIEEMRKINLVGHQHIESRVIQVLQHLGIVQIVNVREEESRKALSSEECQRLEERVSQINKIVSFLSRYEKVGFLQNLWESFFPPKMHFQKDEARHILRTFSEVEAFAQYRNLEEEIDLIKIKRRGLAEEKKDLLPYSRLPLTRKDLTPGETTEIIWGLIPKKAFLANAAVLEKKFQEIWIRTFKDNGKNLFLLLVCLKDKKADIIQFLNSLNFQSGSFSKNQDGSFKDRLKALEEETESLNLIEQKIIKENIPALFTLKPKLLLLHDSILARLQQRYIRGNFVQSRTAFVLGGWIKADDVKNLEEKLVKVFPELEVVISPPPADVQPPVAFRNHSLIKPFEFITRLYGAPNYFEFDPTPFLVPFFAFFFALCITDAGYGLILLLLGLLVLKKLKLEPAQRSIFKVIILCGSLTILVGVLLGSIFCLDFNNLPLLFEPMRGFRNRLMIFDPLENIMLFLGICLGLGVIQIYFGIILKVVLLLKRKKIVEAIFQELSWIFLLSGSILWLTISFGGLMKPALPLAKVFTLAGAGSIFIFAGRGTKNIFLRFGKGLFKLYGTVGMLGDVLSYSRLLALGLATTVIGLAVNIIADLFSKVPFIGFIFGLAIVVLGHGFNLFINSLGGFAHTLRLQFVEFFTKFYEGGGEFFQPFEIENRFTKVS